MGKEKKNPPGTKLIKSVTWWLMAAALRHLSVHTVVPTAGFQPKFERIPPTAATAPPWLCLANSDAKTVAAGVRGPPQQAPRERGQTPPSPENQSSGRVCNAQEARAQDAHVLLVKQALGQGQSHNWTCTRRPHLVPRDPSRVQGGRRSLETCEW